MPEPVSGRRAQRPDHPARPARGARTSRKTVPTGDGDGPLEDQAALELLTRGTLEVEGRLVEASNATLYCSISHQGTQAACVYKPVAGERPLWDFPPGTLAGREVAAYTVSRAASWGIVPPTVMRDGPFGPGMCQLWIDADATTDLIALARSSNHPQLRDMAVFDAVVNNADRKIGHLWIDLGGVGVVAGVGIELVRGGDRCRVCQYARDGDQRRDGQGVCGAVGHRADRPHASSRIVGAL